MRLPRNISESELRERLKLADLEALKDITKSFTKVAFINLNENISANDLRKAIEAVYFRKRELMPEKALKEPIEGTYSFDSLISCYLTERQNRFELYRYLYDHTTTGKPTPREDFYEIAEEFYNYKGQSFNKREIYALVRNARVQQEGMKKKVVAATQNNITLNRIYTWKDHYPIFRGDDG